jgi:hypothetical protein
MVVQGAFWNVDGVKQRDDPEIVIAVKKQHRHALLEQHLPQPRRQHPRSQRLMIDREAVLTREIRAEADGGRVGFIRPGASRDAGVASRCGAISP